MILHQNKQFQLNFQLNLFTICLLILSNMKQITKSLGPTLNNYSIYEDIQHLPIKKDKRECTDIICIIIGLGFTLLLLILTIAVFDYNTYRKASLPADSDGNICGSDKGFQSYKILYFSNPNDIARRVCVKKCPNPDNYKQKKFECKKNQKMNCSFQQPFYQNKFQQNNYGRFCFPTDSTLRQKLLQRIGDKGKQLYYNSIITIKYAILFAIGFSFIFMLLVQFFPMIMNYATIILGIISMFGLTICVIIYPSDVSSTAKIIAILCMILAIFIIGLTVYRNKSSWGINGIFLEHSSKFMAKRFYLVGLILIFLLFMAGFIVLLALQYRSFWSYGNLVFDQSKSVFHHFQKSYFSYVMTALQFIQLLWGLSFIKEAFNFCVSGQAVLWYFQKEECFSQDGPFFVMITKHFGSIIASAFMTAFFSIGDFIADFFLPDNTNKQQPNFLQQIGSFFDLVRSDAQAFIYLSGNGYCNSARYCQYLCDKTTLTQNSQSTCRAYRICAHFFIAGSVAIFSLYGNGQISLFAVTIVVLISLFISTLFISIHADSAEAIQLIFLQEEQFQKRRVQFKPFMQNDLLDWRFKSKKQGTLAEDVNLYKKLLQKEKQKENSGHLDGRN